jgi:hypothetical protein
MLEVQFINTRNLESTHEKKNAHRLPISTKKEGEWWYLVSQDLTDKRFKSFSGLHYKPSYRPWKPQ